MAWGWDAWYGVGVVWSWDVRYKVMMVWGWDGMELGCMGIDLLGLKQDIQQKVIQIPMLVDDPELGW